MTKRKTRALGLAAAALMAVGSASLTANPAHAAHSDAVCNVGEFCFYYNSAAYGYGSLADFGWNIPTFNGTGYRFISGGKGQGVLVWNNAAHVWNRHSSRDARVYENSYYKGKYDVVGKSSRRDLYATKNDNASFRWL